MEDLEKKPRKKRAKKVDTQAYDEYVANVSNGLNPPSAAKRRRRKKADAQAYDEYLKDTEGTAAPEQATTSRRSRREQAEIAEQTVMDLDAAKPKKKRAHAKKKSAEDYDAYLLRSEAQGEEERPARKRRKRRASARRRRERRRKIFAVVHIAVMVLILIGFGTLAFRQVSEYQHFAHMRQVVEDQRFYPGTTVDGYDISGMTLEEAEQLFAGSIEPQYRNRSAMLTTGEMFTAEQLGYTSNYVSVLRTAWAGGREGTLQERYDAIVSGEVAAAAYPVSRTFYTVEGVKAAVDGMAAYIDQNQTDPQINGFDTETLEFTLDDGKPGYELNREKLAADIAHVMANGGGNVEPIINSIPVKVDKEKAMEGYGRISFMSTDAADSSKNRLVNLNLSCAAISGMRLEPGQEFSFNKVVGQRTKARGYKEAPVFGSDGIDYGGGVCQVSSTLFNAVVMADMEITQRSPHSQPVHYLPRGRDAAIDWPDKDLKFKNLTDSPVYLVCRVTDDKQVECAVYGKIPEDGHTVKVTSTTYKTMKYETIAKIDPLLPPGKHEVDQKGRTGYKAQAWKVTLDKDGNEIAKETLCYSTYEGRDEWVRYNPK